MSSEDGGQAFPRPYYPGMTLRDYIAIHAIDTVQAVYQSRNEMVSFDIFAETAYMIADAFLVAREKK